MPPMPTALIVKRKILFMASKEKAGQANMSSTEKYFSRCYEKKGLSEWKEALGQKKNTMD